MRKKWLFLLISPLLMMSLLPTGCSCNCSTNNAGIGGDWNPDALGLSNDMNGDNSSRELRLYESFESLSPDGTKLLHYHGLSLYIMNPDGTDEKELVVADDTSWAMPLDIAWSPDGSKISYRLWWPDGMWSEIWVINVDGSDQTKVGYVPRKYGVLSIVWSADGTEITYTCFDMWAMLSSDSTYQSGPDKTYTVNADGSSLAD
ncbi:TolB family protein [Chloroflexota bacterium]